MARPVVHGKYKIMKCILHGCILVNCYTGLLAFIADRILHNLNFVHELGKQQSQGKISLASVSASYEFGILPTVVTLLGIIIVILYS